MPYLEAHKKWDWVAAATTGGSTDVYQLGGRSVYLGVYFVSGPGCTATVELQTAAESSGPWVRLSTAATNLSTSACVLQQFVGPMSWLRPYVTAKTTGALSIYALGQ